MRDGPSTQQQAPPGLTGLMEPTPDHGEESYDGHGRLAGKKAIITGGDSGIGRAVAIAFAREGADVVISYLEGGRGRARDRRVGSRQAGREVRCSSPATSPSRAQCQRVVDAAVEAFGRIDVLVNNAAFQRTYDGARGDPGRGVGPHFQTNVTAMFQLCKAAVPHMQPGASIINTASMNADQPKPTLLAYATTKGAIANFTAGLAQLLGERGIRVNSVLPGPIWTPLIPSTMPAEQVDEFGEHVPLGPAGPAGRAGAGLRAARLGRGELHLGGAYPVTGGKPII